METLLNAISVLAEVLCILSFHLFILKTIYFQLFVFNNSHPNRAVIYKKVNESLNLYTFL